MINLSARKTGGGVVATLIRGDNHTTRLEIAVARNARDVDLGSLAWRVNICAADGRTDVYTPTEVVVDDREIRFGWLPGGIATAAVGITEFTVVGMADAENPPVWKSDKQYLQIDDCVDAQPSGEQAAQLGELDKLIIFVQGALDDVVAAGEAAAEAAVNARNLPFIGQDGMWRVWDAGKQAYVNTGVRAEGRDGAGAEEFADVKTRISDLENYEQRPFESTGDLVQIDNYEGMPMDCVTRIEPVQSGSGDPSPDNIRPISGRTGAVLTRCGKNLLNGAEFTSRTAQGVTFTANNDGSIAVSGTATGTANTFSDITGTLAAGTYTVSHSSNFVASAYVQVTSPDGGVKNYWDGQPFTLDGTEKKITAYLQISAGTYSGTAYVQIEKGSNATTYEPHQGDTFTLDFGQTVYGGTIDWGKGLLTVDRALVEFKGTEPWNYHANGFVYNNGSVNAKSDKDALITSHYPQINLAGDTIGAAIVSTGSSYNQVRFYGTGYSDANAWKAFLAEQYAAGTPVQIAYKLATPTTIQLTPGQLTALQGLNYIWSDAGETTVSGRKDVLWLTSGMLRRVVELEGLVAALTAAAAE